VDSIKLSICIPTFNRAAFLTKALTHVLNDCKFPFAYEVVVSDNASTDNTRDIVEQFREKGLPIHYFRQVENVGYERNLTGVFRRGRGDYLVYLSDDDLLIPEAVVETVRYLDANPDATAAYAPWDLYDEVARIKVAQFYAQSIDLKFAQRNFVEAFSFLVDNHIFPEIAIYRASALRSAMVPRYFCFWAFVYLAHFLDQGSVAFLARPFYRSVTVSSVRRDREQAGNEEVMVAWDRYRGGLEYFMGMAIGRSPTPMPPAQVAAYTDMIKTFTLIRMSVALRFWVARKDYLRSYELFCRLNFGGLHDNPTVQSLKGSLLLMVAVQTLARIANATASVDRLVLAGVKDLPSLESLLRELELEPRIAVTPEPPQPSAEDASRSIVFVAEDADRRRFLDRGYSPNLVLSEDDLVKTIIIR